MASHLNFNYEISKAFNDSQMSSVLSLDVQKAFDIINWDILFDKLRMLHSGSFFYLSNYKSPYNDYFQM